MPIKVLIADDSAFLRKKISQLLASHNSIEVVNKAKNGEEAVNFTLKHLPDVLILDLMMPKMNGLEAFKRIMDEYPVPTIILSSVGPSTLDSSIQALLIGAFDYIIKPGTIDGENIKEFQDTLIEKVKLASKSQFQKVYKKQKDHFTKVSFRQKRVNEIFEFGKFLKKLESSEQTKSKQKLSDIKDLNKFKKSLNVSDFKTNKKTQIKENSHEKVNKKTKKKKLFKKRKKKEEAIKPKKTQKIDKQHQKNKQSKKRENYFKDKNDLKDRQKKQFRKKKKSSPGPSSLGKDLSKSKIYPDQVERDIITKSKQKQQYISAIDLLSEQEFKTLGIDLHKKIIVIGASVGGPQTIKTILSRISKDFPYPIIIVQHLNSKFIQPFTHSLDKLSPLKVKVAENNETIKNGVVYIAPGEQHIKVSLKVQNPCIKLFDGKYVNFCKPSIDVLFVSSAQVYGDRVIGILLTGMGRDGVKGLEYIYNQNGLTITESKETAILYGMPKFAIQKGVVKKTLPNNEISALLNNHSNE